MLRYIVEGMQQAGSESEIPFIFTIGKLMFLFFNDTIMNLDTPICELQGCY